MLENLLREEIFPKNALSLLFCSPTALLGAGILHGIPLIVGEAVRNNKNPSGAVRHFSIDAIFVQGFVLKFIVD